MGRTLAIFNLLGIMDSAIDLFIMYADGPARDRAAFRSLHEYKERSKIVFLPWCPCVERFETCI